MSTPMRLLIGYNGSPRSDIALRDLQGAGLPASVDAVVLTVADALTLAEGSERVWSPRSKTHISAKDACNLATHLLEEASAIAHAGCRHLQIAFPNWNVQPQVSAGLPAWEIFWKSEELNADLLVVGAHSRSHVGHILEGSVSHTVLTQAFCSVRLAREHKADPQRHLRLLIGIDGSRGAEETVDVVAQRAWSANTEIRLVIGLEPVHFATIASTLVLHDASTKEQNKANQLHAQQVAQAAADIIELHNPALTVSVFIKSGDPKMVLLEEAERWGADCIFLGARGHTWSVRQMLGRVASAVATHAKCSVEVVRSRHQRRRPL